MKHLIAKRLIALIIVIFLAMAIGTTLEHLYRTYNYAFDIKHLPLITVIYTCGWICLGAFMGVIIRPRRNDNERH